mgnify:CR=1 FL=1|tara:strand:- start:32 stop:361 length:330 start_codon:yes stop_codon:yes gene_type:complete
MDAILHEAWVLFVGIGSWFVNRLSSKLDDLDKNKADADQIQEAIKIHAKRLHEMDRRVDKLGSTSINRDEFKSDITLAHNRINDLEQRKAERIHRVDIKMKDGGEHHDR